MLQELLQLLPAWSGTQTTALSIAGGSVFVGLALWLAGARFSRHMVTLILTAIGAGVGLHLPQWMNWSISGAGTAVGGAIALGVIGFLLHRFWIGISLGTVMALFAAFTTWTLLHKDQAWTWPACDEHSCVADYGKLLWEQLPPDVSRILPFAAGVALVSGLSLSVLWPREAAALNWSTIGASLALGGSIFGIQNYRPEWMRFFPAQTWSQLTAFLGLIAFGAIVQWKLAPKRKKASSDQSPRKGQE